VIAKRMHHLADDLRVTTATEGSIQIHQVDPRGTLMNPGARSV